MNLADSPLAHDTPHDIRWHAVSVRDAAADGSFVYAVKTTGIFCRPSCPSRRPKLENVAFFASAAAAAGAGYRPCRRCHPERARSPRDDSAERIRAACRAIEAAEAPPTLAALAGTAGLSRFHFQRLFKRTVGVSPREYFAGRRRERLQRALEQGDSVDGAVYGAGFGSPSRVYEHSGRLLGMSPAAYRNGAAGQRIRRAFARSSLGWVGIAATARGVCGIEIAASRAAAAAQLARRMPHAIVEQEAGALDDWLAAVVAFVEAPQTPLRLPLDIAGTAFQQRVWRALQAVPPGEDGELWRARPEGRCPRRRTSGSAGVRDQPGPARHPLPPGRPGRRQYGWLPAGRRAQARAARAGAGRGEQREARSGTSEIILQALKPADLARRVGLVAIWGAPAHTERSGAPL